MHDARRYRDNAAGCLLAAQQARQPYCRKLRLSMAASWLSLAHRDEAIDNLRVTSDPAGPVKTDRPAAWSLLIHTPLEPSKAA